MKGFKNMKKIVAVLVLALVAMTAVFAADSHKIDTNPAKVNVTLNVSGYTLFGFTEAELAEDASEISAISSDIDMAEHVGSRKVRTVYASVISTSGSGARVKITLPKFMTGKNMKDAVINDEIPLGYVHSDITPVDSDTNTTISYDVPGATQGAVRHSQEIGIYIDATQAYLDSIVSGSYSATLQMTVTAE